METPAIHRIIERHAANRGDAVALVEEHRTLTYRELNHRANLCARRLLSAGFRRGGHARVRMRRSADLAVVLLAILKAGAAYTWRAGDADTEAGLSLAVAPGERPCLTVDAATLLEGDVQTCPNLPILTRASDVACVLPDADGSAVVLVPHATITALRWRSTFGATQWNGDPAAFDLWLVLMAGGTVVVQDQPAVVAA